MRLADTIKKPATLILLALLALSGVAWWLIVRQSGITDASSSMSMDAMEDVRPSLNMGMSFGLYIGMWSLMMVAMMFPTAAPMILTFATISHTRQSKGQSFVPAWFFVASYLALWILFGLIAYLVSVSANSLGDHFEALRSNGARIGGGILLLAGLYQLSPLKTVCLSKCQTPIDFIMRSWKDGYPGALQMGIKHGTYCFGCCWLLFIILIPLGVMNVVAMGLVTALIFAEKSLRYGRQIAYASGVILVVSGVIVLFVPHLLPSTL